MKASNMNKLLQIENTLNFIKLLLIFILIIETFRKSRDFNYFILILRNNTRK